MRGIHLKMKKKRTRKLQIIKKKLFKDTKQSQTNVDLHQFHVARSNHAYVSPHKKKINKKQNKIIRHPNFSHLYHVASNNQEESDWKRNNGRKRGGKEG